jgi:hypothetical protein
MPKRKKTRKQKIIADTRHKSPTGHQLSQEKTQPEQAILTSSPQKQTINVSEFSYLYADLTKTITLTISIIVAELLLKFFLGAQ